MLKFAEAVTIKSQVRGALAALGELLKDKSVPKGLRSQIENLRTNMQRTWSDLQDEATNEAATDEAAVGELSYQNLMSLLTPEIMEQFGMPGPNGAPPSISVLDLYADRVVFRDWNTLETYQVDYAIADDGTITLGAPIGVVSQESATLAPLHSEYQALVEAALKNDGEVSLKLIAPGWGSSGFYPAEVLKRDGPQVFTKGTKMFWNHPTAAEEAARPERDLRDLAAELTSDATWDDSRPAGAGLYARAKVFSPYQMAVNELAPHIGVSIRALGKVKSGIAEGKKGAVIQAISSAKSVDFVTSPGAGGKILELFEAARQTSEAVSENLEEMKMLNELKAENEQLKSQLNESQKATEAAKTEAARLREAKILADARGIVESTLIGIQMPVTTRTRLSESLMKDLPEKDGELDAEALKTKIQESTAAEMKYLAEAAGTGKITGMGTGSPASEVTSTLEESFKRLGMNESAAKIAAKGR